jgi:hypothetical protein
LELDAVLMGWGTDFVLRDGRWSIDGMRRYARGSLVENPFQLRRNAYRVLLTRARDVTVVYVPPLRSLDETYRHLRACGFVDLDRGVGADEATLAFLREPPGSVDGAGDVPTVVAGTTHVRPTSGRAELDRLLSEAAQASATERIEYRDRVAKFGVLGIAAVSPWVASPSLGAFAVRVIVSAAALGYREAAIAALRASLQAGLSDPVLGDVKSELARLSPVTIRPRGSGLAISGGMSTAPRSLPDLVVGAVYRRRDLHRQGLGGNWQKGISYPAEGDYALLFSDPASEHAYGYRDSWLGTDVYRYFGEWNGTGDMTITGGNAAIRDRSPGLHLFTKTARGHRYEGRFRCAGYARERAAREGREFTALIFRLEREPET